MSGILERRGRERDRERGGEGREKRTEKGARTERRLLGLLLLDGVRRGELGTPRRPRLRADEQRVRKETGEGRCENENLRRTPCRPSRRAPPTCASGPGTARCRTAPSSSSATSSGWRRRVGLSRPGVSKVAADDTSDRETGAPPSTFSVGHEGPPSAASRRRRIRARRAKRTHLCSRPGDGCASRRPAAAR